MVQDMDIALFLGNKTELEKHMSKALELAQMSLPDDVPIGAVVVHEDGRVIAQAHNMRQKTHDATDHAEVIAIRNACERLTSKRLHDCILFTTLEPCIMCAGALIQAHIGAVVFGASDPHYGAAGGIYNFFTDPRLSHNAPVIGAILEDECAQIVNDFFASIRSNSQL